MSEMAMSGRWRTRVTRLSPFQKISECPRPVLIVIPGRRAGRSPRGAIGESDARARFSRPAMLARYSNVSAPAEHFHIGARTRRGLR
jgi:hypothetical protein